MSTTPYALLIVKKLLKHGHTAYFAGGWVRDFLMQHPSDDIDIATSASPEEIQKLFPKTIPVGIAFGIVIVVENGHPFEVATFRTDRMYVDGRRPTGFDLASPEEDAKRRDFTINGLFYDPIEKKVLDYVDGRKDIEAKVIRAIGNPDDRFREDRLRMMRAVRYATRFSFTIEPHTLSAIQAHSQEILPAVAMERVWQEFKKMSRFVHFDKGLFLLYKLSLLQRIFPKLKDLSEQEMILRVKHIEKLPASTPTILEILQLFPSISSDEIENLCEYLKVSREEKELVYALHHVENALNMPKAWQKGLQAVEWAYLYAAPHAETCLAVIASKQSDPEGFNKEHVERKLVLKEAIVRIQEKRPLITAQDLFPLGIASGVLMGQLLKEAERISVNQSLFDKEQVLLLLQQSSLWPT